MVELQDEIDHLAAADTYVMQHMNADPPVVQKSILSGLIKTDIAIRGEWCKTFSKNANLSFSESIRASATYAKLRWGVELPRPEHPVTPLKRRAGELEDLGSSRKQRGKKGENGQRQRRERRRREVRLEDGKKGFRRIKVSSTTTGWSSGKKICEAYGRNACNGKNCQKGLHLCDVVTSVNPLKICAGNHPRHKHTGSTVNAG